MRYRIAVVGLIVAVIAVVVFAYIQMHKWYRACDEAGGRVEQRFEYATTDMTNHYDDKGRLTWISVDVTRHYSYHCWANGQEVLDSWVS